MNDFEGKTLIFSEALQLLPLYNEGQIQSLYRKFSLAITTMYVRHLLSSATVT